MWMVGVTAGAATGEVAQGVQVGRVHRSDHERTAARDAALPFEVGGDLKSRRGQDSNPLARPYQAGLRDLYADGRVWANVEAIQGQQRGSRVLRQAHSMSCLRSSSLKATAALRNNSGPLKPEYFPADARCGSSEKKPSKPEPRSAERFSGNCPSPSPAGTTVSEPYRASFTCTYSIKGRNDGYPSLYGLTPHCTKLAASHAARRVGEPTPASMSRQRLGTSP